MNHRRILLVALALLGLVALGCAMVTTGERPKNKSPYLPSAETLERLSLDLVWHAEVDASDIVKAYLLRDTICLETASLQFYAIDASTGLIRWQTQFSLPPFVGPCDNSKQVFLIDSGLLRAFDKATGQVMWRTRLYSDPAATPAASDTIVFVSTADHDIKGFSTADGKLMFTYHTRGAMAARPAAEGDTVYTGDEAGCVYAVSSIKKEIPWQKKPFPEEDLVWERQLRKGVQAPVELSEKAVLVGCGDWLIYALDKATGAPLWQHSTGSMVLAEPTCVEGAVYVTSFQNGIHAYDAVAGNPLWTFADGTDFVTAAGDKYVYLRNQKGKIVALDKKTGAVQWMLAPSRYDFVLKNRWTSPIFMASKDGRVVAIAEKGAKMLTYQPPAPPSAKPAPKKAAPKLPAPKKAEE
jgi:outer membrane protein assembly factor BamB